MGNEMILDLIKALDSVGATNIRAMFDIKRDGRKFWLHIDLYEETDESSDAEEE